VKRHTQSIAIALCAFVIVAFNSPAHGEEKTITALEAKAVAVAFAAYQKMVPRVNLRLFSVIIGRDGRDYDIVFLPDSPPGEEAGTGGGTRYGAEVHFIISPRTFKVVRWHLAR
jgi:hypothetical protein